MTILRARVDELKPIDFQPTIVGLDVTEIPPEQSAVFMLEFPETERAHHLTRRAAAYDGMDSMLDLAESNKAQIRAEWADTVPMADEVAA
jgi:hypothetical protein